MSGKYQEHVCSKDFKFNGDNYEEIEAQAERHARRRGVPENAQSQITYHRGGKIVRFTWVWIEGL